MNLPPPSKHAVEVANWDDIPDVRPRGDRIEDAFETLNKPSEGPGLSSNAVGAIMGIHRDKAGGYLKRLLEAGRVVRKGNRTYYYWIKEEE